MKKIIFWLRYKLMPSEFKEGTWFGFNGDFYDYGDFWIKDKKGWKLPEIRYETTKAKNQRHF